ncbi:hypothetical protein TgHK011_007558 [Trichoderma gracile]|nr:hypothetical protein TgHK011_007558 [Trichoderma gracile]
MQARPLPGWPFSLTLTWDGRILFSLGLPPVSLSIPQSSSLAGPVETIVDGFILSIIDCIVNSFTSNRRLPRCSKTQTAGRYLIPRTPERQIRAGIGPPEPRTPSLDLAVITAIRSIRRLSTPASPPIRDLSLSFSLSFAPKGRTPPLAAREKTRTSPAEAANPPFSCQTREQHEPLPSLTIDQSCT